MSQESTEPTEPKKQRDIGGKEEEEREEETTSLGLPPEILESLPPEVRPKIRRAMSLSMMAGQFALPHPLFSKLTKEHIDKMLDYTESDNVRQQMDRAANRKYASVIAVIVLMVVVALVVYLTQMKQTDVLLNLVIAIVSFAGGFGGGFGVAHRPK